MELQKLATPLMQQYFKIRADYPDTLLLFQVGDFYELFFDDAKTVASFLGIALTKRGTYDGQPIPLCGVPVHTMDHYVAKLVRGGFKVALCDQLEEATPGKMVDRGVTRVLTPGTLTDSKLLDAKSASYLFSFFPAENQWGLLFGELLTAQLFATVLPPNMHKILESELIRFFPDEILIPQRSTAKPFQTYFKQLGYVTTFVTHPEDVGLSPVDAQGWLSQQFRADAVAKIAEQEGLRHALYGFHEYLKKNQATALEQFRTINFYQPEDFLILDGATQKNLEIVKSLHGNNSANTLFELLDGAVTPMGSRTLKKWLVRPLVKQEAITARHEVVDLFSKDYGAMEQLESALKEIGDLERVVGRIALRRAMVHDYLMLSSALALVPTIKNVVAHKNRASLLALLESKMVDFSVLQTMLSSAINDDPTKEWIIRAGFDQELDKLRLLVHNSQSKILEFELQEQQRTGISSLKVRYNQIHGYYIEITKANFDLIPPTYIRQQTLVGRERFTTPELRALQGEILNAQKDIGRAEVEIFERVKMIVFSHLTALRHLAASIAHLDGLLGLSLVAYRQGYVRPVFNNERMVHIEQGKHPVVAAKLAHQFIPNDTHLDDEQSLWIITGPNMGGKSTYMRQVALISIMAQSGSFVPATSANLPILDRIFTRIGAGDNVADGKSTFLVEMEETAAICAQATPKSLVILDEVGRGTSTFDGLAIAQAVVEHIYEKVRARCLFATHYHELTSLPDRFSGVRCYHAASKKTEKGILFLYTMTPGAADGSFGLEVAKLAEVPSSIITRAQEILRDLTNAADSGVMPVKNVDLGSREFLPDQQLKAQLQAAELELMTYKNLAAKIRALDYENLSPRKAFDLLWALKGQSSEVDSSWD